MSGFVGGSQGSGGYLHFVKMSSLLIIFLFIVMIINNTIFFKYIGKDTLNIPKKKSTVINNTIEQNKTKNIMYKSVAYLSICAGLVILFTEQFWKKNIQISSSYYAQQQLEVMENIVHNKNEKAAKLLVDKYFERKDISITDTERLKNIINAHQNKKINVIKKMAEIKSANFFK